MPMASLKIQRLMLFGTILVVIFFSVPVNSGHSEDDLLHGLNSYRKSKSLPPLKKQEISSCLADEIADEVEDQPCPRQESCSNTMPMKPPPFSDYKNALTKCKVNIHDTKDWVILPACVKERCASLILSNYTQTPFATYVNDPKFSGAGVEMEDYWTVVVLTTGSGGSVASNAAFAHKELVGRISGGAETPPV